MSAHHEREAIPSSKALDGYSIHSRWLWGQAADGLGSYRVVLRDGRLSIANRTDRAARSVPVDRASSPAGVSGLHFGRAILARRAIRGLKTKNLIAFFSNHDDESRKPY